MVRRGMRRGLYSSKWGLGGFFRCGVSLRAQSFSGIVEVELAVDLFGEGNPFCASKTHSGSVVRKCFPGYLRP